MRYLSKAAQKLFVDKLVLKAQGGNGGNGLPQFGGIGGRGGDVCVVGSKVAKLDSIENLSVRNGWVKAGDGSPALRTRLLGKPGNDLMIKVPLGVSITDSDGQSVGNINEADEKIIIALGGRGGDKFNEHHGYQGQRRVVKLDLQMISDAVFVGFPNAGKSSLLKVVSNARPKVAAYPFTTLRPYLGLVQFDDYRQITMADLPGLVEGAHKNVGLGHEFLKHIVRSRVLIFVIDVNPVDLGPNYAMRTPLETLCILNKEIEIYDDTILNKPALLAVSKVDSFTSGGHMEKFFKFKEDLTSLHDPSSSLYSDLPEYMRPKRLVKFDEVLPISAKFLRGIGKLKQATRDVIDKYAEMNKLDSDKISSYEEIQLAENNRLLR